MRISVIIPSRNEGMWLPKTVHSLIEAARRDGLEPDIEFIVVDDGSVDGVADDLSSHKKIQLRVIHTDAIGPARARNSGARLSVGDTLLFCDAHVEVSPGVLRRMIHYLDNTPQAAAVSPGIGNIERRHRVGYGLTWASDLRVQWLHRPFNEAGWVPFLPGAFLAVRRRIFELLGGFDPGFYGYGHEDEEFSLRLWLMGHQLHVLYDSVAFHYFRHTQPYAVKPSSKYYNLLRLASVHFDQKRLEHILRLVQLRCNLPQIMAQLLLSDCAERRQALLRQRVFDDDWFMRTFRISF